MDPRTIKQAASDALLDANYNPKKLAMLHTGVVVLFSLVTSLLSYLLEMGVANTGGLAGLGLRSALESAQVVLSLAGSILLPFWQIGFIYAAIRYSRREAVSAGTLLEGFRKFGPVFRLNLLLSLIAIGVIMASMYIATTIFLFSPMSDGLYAAAESLLEATQTTAFTEDMLLQILPHMGWLLGLYFVILLLIELPIYYRYRMSEFALMAGAPGARAAMRESILISRRRRMDMLKFDFSFWWYYALQLLLTTVAYADVILTASGVTLPVSADALYWILLVIYAALSLLFARQYGAYYQIAYARYYDLLKENTLPPAGAPTEM